MTEINDSFNNSKFLSRKCFIASVSFFNYLHDEGTKRYKKPNLIKKLLMKNEPRRQKTVQNFGIDVKGKA